ncbi:MAG TPA: ABC transporter ATP-binding protein [Gemmatimonadaceae bacterium]|nr:ABC transporter ATP-binding protein [Gemmatimonadaceae bacterium]
MDVYTGADGTVIAPPALALRGVTKRFGEIAALNAASLIVKPSTVHALLGENGAGKTTLMRVAYGLTQPDGGVIERNGQRVRWRTPGVAIAHGIAMVQQHFSLVPAMTVAENVALGGHGMLDLRAIAERVKRVAERYGLAVDPDARVGDLSVAQQQRVEIVKALARDASLLILDEPTAVLAPSETEELLARLRAFAREGNAVVLITHKLRDALQAADDITVLRRGATALEVRAGRATPDDLVAAMLGARVVPPVRTTGAAPGAAVLSLSRVTVRDARSVDVLRDVSVSVRAGELVGVAGLEGSGHQELLRVLAGRRVPSAGTRVGPARVGFVPEDRHRDALLLDESLIANVALSGLAERRGRMPWKQLETDTLAIIRDFDVTAAGPSAPARSLSGGNQQRFVLGRELLNRPPALVCENPARGLDAAAAARIFDRLREARDAGCAVVFHSGDVDELIAYADRIIVCHRGSAREVERTANAIARALVGAEG